MKRILFTIFGLILFTSLGAQQDRAVRDTGGGGGGWLKDSLAAGDVAIQAASNDLIINDMDSLALEAELGVLFKSTDIWFSQATPNTTNLHLSPFNNWTGTGYVNGTMDYWNFTADDSLSIIIDDVSANKRMSLNGQIFIDKFGGLQLANYPSSFTGYGSTDEGKIVYNETDNLPMFWNGTQWENLAGEAAIPSGPQSNLSFAEMSGQSINFAITTTQTNFTSSQFAIGDESGADWAYDATNDELDFTGTTGWFLISYVATGTIGSGSLNTISMVLEKNNSTITGSLSTQIVTNTDDDGVTFAGTVFVSLSSGDSINAAMFCALSTAEFDCDNLSITAFKLPGQ